MFNQLAIVNEAMTSELECFSGAFDSKESYFSKNKQNTFNFSHFREDTASKRSEMDDPNLSKQTSHSKIVKIP